MTILLISPGRSPRKITIDNPLAAMQRIVGGHIQAVYPFEEPVALICHEEGTLLRIPLNRALRSPDTGEIYDIIAGDFFLCAAPPDSEHCESLTNDQLERYARVFRTPELFPSGPGSSIIVLPLLFLVLQDPLPMLFHKIFDLSVCGPERRPADQPLGTELQPQVPSPAADQFAGDLFHHIFLPVAPTTIFSVTSGCIFP